MKIIDDGNLDSFIAFTICSNNYIAHAKTLADSFKRHNPKGAFYIGLVDKLSKEIDYSFIESATIVELNSTNIPGFDNMVNRYNIVELNTAVKPFLFKYLIKNYKPTAIYYIDPDIKFYQSIGFMNELLRSHSILLTPHFFNPIPVDGKSPFENLALNYGIYNLGFLGLSATHSETDRFLDWWSERTFKFGYSRTAEGFFVDQLWINLVPLFFKGVKIIEHHGCNMAPWNLHERRVYEYKLNGDIVLDNRESLVFYHFSSYSFKTSEKLSRYYDRYDFDNMHEIRRLYDEYLDDLKSNRVYEFSKITCGLPIVTYQPRLKHKVIRRIMPILNSLWKKI